MKVYEKPVVEVIRFQLEQSIASSEGGDIIGSEETVTSIPTPSTPWD